MFLQFGDEFGDNLIMMCLESLKFGEPGNKKSLKKKKKKKRGRHFLIPFNTNPNLSGQAACQQLPRPERKLTSTCVVFSEQRSVSPCMLCF